MDTQEKLKFLEENVCLVRERLARAAQTAGRRSEELLLCAFRLLQQ